MSVQDSRISFSKSKVVTLTLWTWMVAVLTASWVAWFEWGPGLESLWMMLGFTGCVSSGVAATAQVRCYSVNVCATVRARTGVEVSRAPVRPIR